MSRLQLALNVNDLESAVEYYSALFGTPPHKREPGYANFAIADPPLKLVIFEGAENGTLNHIGIEHETPADVDAAMGAIAERGLPVRDIGSTMCCFAEQRKFYVDGADGLEWEVYAVTDDQPTAEKQSESMCCAPAASCC